MRLIQAFLCAYLGIGYVLVSHWYPDVSWMQTPLMGQFWPIIITLAGLFLVAMARVLRSRDPNLVGWMAFSLVGCLLLVPLLFARFHQESVDQGKVTRLLDLREQVVAQQRRKAQLIREEERRVQSSRPRDRFSQYEGRVDILSLQAIRALDEQMQALVQGQASRYDNALEANPVLGPSTWVTFQSLEQLDQERQAHQKLYAATRAFTAFIESFEERYTTAMAELQLKPPADRIAIAEMERVLQSWEASHTYELRKWDVELLAAALNALDVLHEAWGQWNYSPRDKDLSFENPTMEARFQEAMQRFQTAIKSVQALRESETEQGN